MNPILLRAVLPAVLAAALSAPAGAAVPILDELAAKAYLARVTATPKDDSLVVRLRIRGEARPELAYRPGVVQVTLRHAFLDPAKQHVPVNRGVVREVFAYQLDADTVRVRVLTDGVDVRTLEGGAALTPAPDGLRLSLKGLPQPPAAPAETSAPAVAMAPEPTPAPEEAVAPAPVEEATPDAAPLADATPPEAIAVPEPEPVEAEIPPVTDGSDAPFPPRAADSAADVAAARADALKALEGILASHGGADASAPAPASETAWLASVRAPDGAAGGGAPALTPPEVPVTDAPDPSADAAPVSAPTSAKAPAPAPLRPLPVTGSGAPSLWLSGLKMAGGLFTVLALILVGVAALRRFRVGTLGGRVPIRVLASASVGSRQNIVVVEVEGRRLVVGVGPSGTELLANLGTAEATAADPGADHAVDPAAVPAPKRGRLKSPFDRMLKAAGNPGAAEAIARTTRDLERRLRLLRERSA